MEYQTVVKVQNKGLVTIPKDIRKMLGIKEQGYLRLSTKAGKVILESVSILPYPVRSYSNSELKEFFELDQAEAKRK